MSISVEIDGELDVILAQFKAVPQKINTAIRRALRKLGRFAERQVLRELSASQKITQKKLKEMGRVKASLVKGRNGDYLNLWVGTWNIAAHQLGRPMQTKSGVRAGRHQWAGAFLATPRGSQSPIVFRRAPNARHIKRRSKKTGRMMWMAYPIERVTVSIYDDAEAIIARIAPDLLSRFTTLIEQELNYALRIES